jgi:hypothetical protein
VTQAVQGRDERTAPAEQKNWGEEKTRKARSRLFVGFSDDRWFEVDTDVVLKIRSEPRADHRNKSPEAVGASISRRLHRVSKDHCISTDTKHGYAGTPTGNLFAA